MRLKFSSKIIDLLELVRSLLNSQQDLYIVGGAVRDALLGRKLHDLDFAMSENPTALARNLAKHLDAGFFVLDDERHTARVILQDGDDIFFPLDFVQYTGSSLHEDLKNRDFTINAMAVSIWNLAATIDPLDGEADLAAGLIRACSDSALRDDPVRVLRGVRLAVQFDFDFATGLGGQMCEAAAFLPQTSHERQRDEFFRILEGPDPAWGIKYCREFGIFDTLIPHLVEQEPIPASPPHVLPLFDHTIAVVGQMDDLLQCLKDGRVNSDDSAWWLQQALAELGQFSHEIGAYFEEEITPLRTKHSLALFGSLLHDVGKPLTVKTGEDGRLHYYDHAQVGAEIAWATAKRFQLSNAESDWVGKMVRYHMDLIPMVNSADPPDRLGIYRFFKNAGEAGVAISLLSLADTIATYGDNLSREKWNNSVNVTRVLLSAWWEHHETIVSPSLLLDGNDLQAQFELKPGKEIGWLLAQLAEAQASGKVVTKEDALDFILARIANNGS